MGLIDEGRLERSWTFQKGQEKGEKLGRTECETLRARLDTVGPVRLGDVVLDLSPDTLAAWLGDPDAR